MSVVRGFGLNGAKFFTNVKEPKEINLQFTVNHADTGGLGVTGIKSNGYVEAVFMNTNQTAGVYNGFTNPNPLAGFCLIKLKQNLNLFLDCLCEINSPNSGSAVKIDNSAMTVGQLYVITVLGNATAAKWTAIGVPAGVTPAVGVVFVAATNGGTGNTLTSRVQAPGVSGISSFEIVGNPNISQPSPVASNGGQWLYGQFLTPASVLTMNSYTPAGTITNGTPDTFAGTPAVLTGTIANTSTATAPTDGSIISLQLYFDGSTVTIPDSSGQTTSL